MIDGSCTLTLVNALDFTGPAAPAVAVITNNGLITGGTLRTHGSVQLVSGGNVAIPIEVVDGTTLTQGIFSNVIVIDSGGTLKLTGTLTASSDLTIDGGGAVDLAGQAVWFSGNLKTFTNNGLLTNSGSFNYFYFLGDFITGDITQAFDGNGSYSPTLSVYLVRNVTVNVSPSTSLTYDTAANNNNFGTEGNSILNAANALTITAPPSGINYVGVANNGYLTGAGGLKTNGNVSTIGNSNFFTAPIEIVSGAANGNGTFVGAFKIETGASFQMLNTLALYGDLTIQNGATLDLNGQQTWFFGNNKTFANNGSIINLGAANYFYFLGDYVPGSVTQHVATSTGTITDNLVQALSREVTLVLDGDAQFGALVVEGGCIMDISNHTLKLSHPGTPISMAGSLTMPGSTVEYNGVGAQILPTLLTSYHNLTANNPAGVTGFAGLTVDGLMRVTTGTFSIGSSTLNNVQINNTGTLAGVGNPTVDVSGNWTNDGTAFSAANDTVNFKGSGAQVIGGTAGSTFRSLTIANTGLGVGLGQDITVNTSLTLTSDLNAGIRTVTMPGTATSSGNGDVVGNVKRTGFVSGGPALSFGNPFISIDFSVGGTLPTDVNVNLVRSAPSGGMSFPNAVLRTYTITPNGGSSFSATVRLHYLDSELNGNNEANLQLWRFNGTWAQQAVTANSFTNNWVERSGVTQFSAWAISSMMPPTPTATNTATITPTNTATNTATPTNTQTSTPSATPTNTATDTPTAMPSATVPVISGRVTYGNAIGAPSPRYVSNVQINGDGLPPVFGVTEFPGGTYSLSGFGSGAYHVTPGKNGGINGAITSFDAARVAQHAAGPPFPQLAGNQLIAADVSNNGAITSFDAAMIAKFVAGPPYVAPGIGLTASWKFIPASRDYPSITTDITGEDYTALLMGEISGNWTNTGARPENCGGAAVSEGDRSNIDCTALADMRASTAGGVRVMAPQLVIWADNEIVVPLIVDGAADKGIISYEFELRYDPTVIQPQEDPVDLAGTVSRGLIAVANAKEPGRLRVAVYGPRPIDRNGLFLNLRFTAVGKAGSVSPLTFERIMFNEGEPRVVVTDGAIEIF